MFRKTFSLLLVLGLFNAASFTNTAIIEYSGENRYKAIRLTPEVYNNANSDLSDLRIVDASGEFVPYFINSGYQADYIETARYPMSLIDSYLKDDNFYFDYALAESFDRDILSTAVEFTVANTTFAKNVDVYGSYDNIHWEFIQKDQLYSVSDKSKLTINFSSPQKYTHYRLCLSNNLERIAFDNVDLVYNLETTQKRLFIEQLTPGFSIEEKDRETYIYIEGLKNIRLSRITIDTETMFQRTVEAPSLRTEHEVFNLTFGDTDYRDTSIVFNQKTSREDTLLLIIHNGDDRPIHITGITVFYYVDELVFEGVVGQSYTLCFGAEDDVSAPIYDIARYQDEILKGDIDRLEIGIVSSVEVLPEPAQGDFRMAFNIVIIAVAVLLGLLILLKLRKNTATTALLLIPFR